MGLTSHRRMNRINPAKLPDSKWTAREPVNGERHFVVVGLIRDADEAIVGCELEAVINRNRYEFDWHVLRDDSVWSMGWK